MAEWMHEPPGDAVLPRPPRALAEAAGVVLIVDDIPDNLAVLHDALDESGYTVLVATDGASAIARAAQALPDIVLLDALMPGMDGFEVARRIRADPALARLPVVALTGWGQQQDRQRTQEAGFDRHLVKPADPLALRAVLDTLAG